MTLFEKLIASWLEAIKKGHSKKKDFTDTANYINLSKRDISNNVSKDNLYHSYKLLIDDGEHQWHLNSSFINSRDKALEIIARNKLWEVDYSSWTFDAIFDNVRNLLVEDGKRLSGITQLTCYDIALRIVVFYKNGNYPDKVYVHALPGKTSKRILDIYYPERMNRWCEIIPSSIYEPLFPSLQPFQVEWILCDIGKAIRHYESTGKPRPYPWDKFDEEVIRLIKAGKI